MTDGRQLRKDILKARNAMPAQERAEKSRRICKTIFDLDEVKNSSSIFLYVNFRSEVETMPLLQALLDAGKTVSVPITLVDDHRLDAIRITDPASQLEPGYCDIPEPAARILESNLVQPENLDVILLPGSVFDERCGRFGYGGGFYDRFVSKVPQAKRIGVAFELQIVDKAPLQDHDELLDLVVTEERVIRGQR